METYFPWMKIYKKLLLNKIWRIWANALGNKISNSDRESDIAAIIRTFYWLLNVITCFFIIANAGRNLKLW